MNYDVKERMFRITTVTPTKGNEHIPFQYSDNTIETKLRLVAGDVVVYSHSESLLAIYVLVDLSLVPSLRWVLRTPDGKHFEGGEAPTALSHNLDLYIPCPATIVRTPTAYKALFKARHPDNCRIATLDHVKAHNKTLYQSIRL